LGSAGAGPAAGVASGGVDTHTANAQTLVRVQMRIAESSFDDACGEDAARRTTRAVGTPLP
jgi:hypothetical protein